MKVYVITTRAFKGKEYFESLEETAVKNTDEEAKEEFQRQYDDLCDFFFEYGPLYADSDYIDDNTYKFTDRDGDIAILTMREVEI